MIYEPAEDSYLLQKCVKKYAKGSVLDMGSGSGIQAEAAIRKGLNVLAADINPEAVSLLIKKGINAKVSDLFSNIKEKFDTIIFNPPYLPEDAGEDKESKTITCGGKKGHEIIEKFIFEAKHHLKKNGIILIVASSLSGDMEKLFNKHGYEFKAIGSKKLFFEVLTAYKLKIKT